MIRQEPGKCAARTAESREDRLKAALKANLARRKAQIRARAMGGADGAADSAAVYDVSGPVGKQE